MHLFSSKKALFLVLALLGIYTVAYASPDKPFESSTNEQENKTIMFQGDINGNKDNLPTLAKGAEGGFSEEQFKKAVNLLNTRSYKDAEGILLRFVGDSLWKEKANFLLGRLYKEQNIYDKAEEYLKRVISDGQLLKDYALKLLIDIYTDKGELRKVIEISRQIQNKTLIQWARQAEINALVTLKDEKSALNALSKYVKEYPQEWNYKMLLAMFLEKENRKKAVALLKELYISATPFATAALKELNMMGEDKFTTTEKLQRAQNLFQNGSYHSAEIAYEELLKEVTNKRLKSEIRFSLANCQFRQKKYEVAAKNLEHVKKAEALYLMAKCLLRVNDMDGFSKIIKKIKEDYPKSKFIPMLLNILADEKRRKGEFDEAEKIYKGILSEFPEEGEDALWGLGWMYYTNSNYKEAGKIFSQLISVNEKGQYLYWYLKNYERLYEANPIQEANLNPSLSAPLDSYYERLLSGNTYYGFLARMQIKGSYSLEKMESLNPVMPKGEVYERIEALRILGMNREAIEEIKMALRAGPNIEELKYLGNTAIESGEYKSIIYIAEALNNKEFLIFSYPRGFWNDIKETAESKGIDPYLILAIIREESRFDTMAVSPAGAIGLMQLMPYTARRIQKDLNIKLKDSSELHDAPKNIPIGIHYFSLLVREFEKIPLAVAAYNAGENILRKWLSESNHKGIEEFIEDIPYQETRNYVKKVLKSYWQYKALYEQSLENQSVF